MKSKSSSTSIWSNDGDPFAASPTTSLDRSTSFRSSSTSSRPTPTTGISNSPTTSQPPSKKRMSLLLSDGLFSSLRTSTSSRTKSSSIKKHPSLDVEEDDVLDIRGPPLYEDEEKEREALRHEAARSVGLVPAAGPPVQEEDETHADGSYEFVKRPSAPYSLALSHSHSGFSTEMTASAASSQASLSVETTHQTVYPSPPIIQQPKPAVRPSKPSGPSAIPTYPATLASLTPFAAYSSTLMRHYAGSSFFLGKSRQWKSRYIVLTSFKPPSKPLAHTSSSRNASSKHKSTNSTSDEPDTQAHLHLFRSFASEERELERMRIDEDSVVFVVEDDGAVTQGRKNVIKVGGRHAGGGGSHSAVNGGGRARTALAPPSAMASLSVMGAPAMAVQLGGQVDFKVVWLLQCPDSQSMHGWIAAVKGALLVQRAERAGLGMSLQTSPADVRLTGDIDVILSLRAQGLLNQNHLPASPTSPGGRYAYGTAPVSAAAPVEEPKNAAGGRSRSSTTTAPSVAVNALKGLFTSSIANGPSSVNGTSSRPRSISSVASTPIPMASPANKPMPLEDDPKDASFGTRANAMLNMHLSRSTAHQSSQSHQQPSSSSSLILDRSIRDSLVYDEPLEMDFELKQKENRERLNALAAFASVGGPAAGAYERPPSVGSLPPPPRTKRPGSAGQQQPKTPVFEKDLQDELKKAMFAPVLEPASRSRRSSLRDVILEEEEVLGRYAGGRNEVLSIRTSIDEQGRVSIEQGRISVESMPSNRRGSEVEDVFPERNGSTLLPPIDVGAELHRSQFGMKSSASFGVDLIHAATYGGHPHHPHHHRPASAMSSVSTNSFHGNGSATPGASEHMSPRSTTSSSDGRTRSTSSGIIAATTTTRGGGPSSPQRSRRVPKVMIPPAAPPPSVPLPSAPLPGTPGTTASKSLHPEDASVSTKERDSRSSFFAASNKRVSAASSTGISIRSFTSGSSSSRSGSMMQRSVPQRPPPTFALPPTPPVDEGRDLQRASMNSTYSAEFGGAGSVSAGMGSAGKRMLNRLTPPSNPPTGALPPRPSDADDPPLSPASHRSGSSGSLNNGHHHRTSSIISNGAGAGALSTIPASPVDRVLPDLSPLSGSPDLPDVVGGMKRIAVTSSPSIPPAGLVPGASVTRQGSLKSRLRMLSTPSPRLSASSLPPPTSALPDPPSITHAMKIVDPSAMSFDLALPSPSLDRPIMSPFGPDEDRGARENAGSPILGSGAQTPPIPPRSQARPTSPRLKLPETPPMMGLPLSPPPARRGGANRASKDFGLSGLARVNAALALDAVPAGLHHHHHIQPVSEDDDVDPLDPAMEHWEPSRRDSVMIPL